MLGLNKTMTKTILSYAGALVVGFALCFFAFNHVGIGAVTGLNSINLTPSSGAGDTYSMAVNGNTAVDINGNLAGQIIQTSLSNVNVITGTTVTNDLIQGSAGFALTLSTSTALTAAQFCAATSIRVVGTPAAMTLTLPAATSSWLACGSPNAGSWSTEIIVNDSTNTVTIAGGTGVSLRNGSSSTAIASNVLNQTSTMIATGIWDTTSTLYINQESYH